MADYYYEARKHDKWLRKHAKENKVHDGRRKRIASSVGTHPQIKCTYNSRRFLLDNTDCRTGDEVPSTQTQSSCRLVLTPRMLDHLPGI